MAGRAAGEGVAAVQQGVVVGHHQVAGPPAVCVEVGGVVEGGTQAVVQFDQLRLVGETGEFQVGVVDETVAGLGGGLVVADDRRAVDRGSCHHRGDGGAVVVLHFPVVGAGGPGPQGAGGRVGVGEHGGGVGERGLASLVLAGRVDALEDLELGDVVPVHAVPVHRHVAVVEDVVGRVVLLDQFQHGAERPHGGLTPVLGVRGEFGRLGECREVAQQQ